MMNFPQLILNDLLFGTNTFTRIGDLKLKPPQWLIDDIIEEGGADSAWSVLLGAARAFSQLTWPVQLPLTQPFMAGRCAQEQFCISLGKDKEELQRGSKHGADQIT